MGFFYLLYGLFKKNVLFCLFFAFLPLSVCLPVCLSPFLRRFCLVLLSHRSDWSRCERSWPRLWGTASDVTAGCNLWNIILSHGGKCAAKARPPQTLAAAQGKVLNYWLLRPLHSVSPFSIPTLTEILPGPFPEANLFKKMKRYSMSVPGSQRCQSHPHISPHRVPASPLQTAVCFLWPRSSPSIDINPSPWERPDDL